jgi:hypothetical protein
MQVTAVRDNDEVTHESDDSGADVLVADAMEATDILDRESVGGNDEPDEEDTVGGEDSDDEEDTVGAEDE